MPHPKQGFTEHQQPDKASGRTPASAQTSRAIDNLERELKDEIELPLKESARSDQAVP